MPCKGVFKVAKKDAPLLLDCNALIFATLQFLRPDACSSTDAIVLCMHPVTQQYTLQWGAANVAIVIVNLNWFYSSLVNQQSLTIDCIALYWIALMHALQSWSKSVHSQKLLRTIIVHCNTGGLAGVPCDAIAFEAGQSGLHLRWGIELRAVNLCTMNRGEGGGEDGAQADDGRPEDWGPDDEQPDDKCGIMILEAMRVVMKMLAVERQVF